MKSKLKKAMGMALAFCMAAVMLCGGLAEVQAAGYKKSITKNPKVDPTMETSLIYECKKDCKVTVTISTTSKKKDLNLNAVVSARDNIENVSLSPDKKKKTITINVKKDSGFNIFIANYGSGKVKVKVKVSASGKVLKLTHMGQEAG